MIKFITISLILFSGLINTFAQHSNVTSVKNLKTVTLQSNSVTHSVYPLSNSSAPEIMSKTNPEQDSFSDWNLFFSTPGKVFKDVYFVNPQIGYIATELGAVYKTTNGGMNWVSMLNLGFPYYWYGVFALSPDTLIISGFNNQGNINSGVMRWSYNGGTNWSNNIIVSISGGVGWLDRVHFFNRETGIVFAGLSGAIHYTTNGGHDSASWHYVQVNTDGAWFAGNYDFQKSGNIYATGIYFAKSTNFGMNWSTFPSADNVFDGGVDFLDNNVNYGWTGGGQISSPVSGWVHRTTDAGTTWSERLNTFSYPIRAVKFFNQNTGIACGGNVNGETGGIYSTTNGGVNWNLDINTSAEMFSINVVDVSDDSIDIWCVGSTGGSTGFIGKAYKTRVKRPDPVSTINSNFTDVGFYLYQNYPNPFNPETIINYQLTRSGNVSLKVYDVLGNEIVTLVNEKQSSGNHRTNFNGVGLPSGIYFYTIETGAHKQTRKMMLMK